MDTVYGFHVVETLLKRTPERVLCVYIDTKRDDARASALRDRARTLDIAVQECNDRTLARKAGMTRHQGLVAEVKPLPRRSEHELAGWITTLHTPPLLLVLDGVQDPHNLGACLRTAEAAGTHAVVIPKDRACAITPAVRKAASGAADLIPVFQVANLARALKFLKSQGLWLIGTAEDSEHSLFRVDFTGATAIILGGEQAGMRHLTRELCDAVVRIPGVGAVSSLNVSVAAGVCLFEALRQRSAAA